MNSGPITRVKLDTDIIRPTLKTMSDLVGRAQSAERNVRSPSFEVPEYHITFQDDGTLQWAPPAASMELALALSYHFPKQKTLEDKMQAAMRRFLRASKKRSTQTQHDKSASAVGEAGSKMSEATPLDSFIPETALAASKVTLAGSMVNHNLIVRSPLPKSIPNSGSQSAGMSQVIWKADTGEEVHLKPKKRQYAEAERIKVGTNRGKVCEEHRQKKQKVSEYQILDIDH